ncbi:hypothetical protein CYMTET_50006 [Cymbomonas tetramitiformis]|uniref:Nucleotide-diphospho-sugar transferase domain-containing protein n=1 Tax=Cymbomonas tetramitiformis TaxID=36881 RepID=A0AAE0BNZ6_9CHLO|nr:hypothetical protein CYMTET_50006 [Cymbomonas tetramitiformis]
MHQERVPGHVITFPDLLRGSANNLTGVASNLPQEKDLSFANLVAAKPLVLVHFARWGFDTFFTDADVLILQNPYDRLDSTCDMSFQHERRKDLRGLNSGCFAWSASKNDTVVKLMLTWTLKMAKIFEPKGRGLTDQEVMQSLMTNLFKRDRGIQRTPLYPARAHLYRAVGLTSIGPRITNFTFCTLDAHFYLCGNHLPCTKQLKQEKGGRQECDLNKSSWEQTMSRNVVLAHHNDMIHNEDKIVRAKLLGFWLEGKLPLD